MDPVVRGARERPTGPSARVVIIIVLLVIIVFAAAAGMYHGNSVRTPSPQTVSLKTCTNGATNYPNCNNNVCTNSATNYPYCNDNTCANGATNYPNCNNNTCPNGALNPPACSVYSTQTVLTCNPSTVHVNLTTTDCTVDVSDTTVPTGTVSASCTPRPGQASGDCATATCTLSPVSQVSSNCRFTTNATGPRPTVELCAEYPGDNAHHDTSKCFILNVLPPPEDVTVTGTVSVNGFFMNPTRIHFVNPVTGQIYNARVRSGSYTLSLTNFQSYNVKIDYDTLTGSDSCDAGTLNLHPYSETLQANYQC